MVLGGAALAGVVALAAATLTFIGVIYTARAQKEPTIIRVGQEVAADAITTLKRERDEARSCSAVQAQAISTQVETIGDLRDELAEALAAVGMLEAENAMLRRLCGGT